VTRYVAPALIASLFLGTTPEGRDDAKQGTTRLRRVGQAERDGEELQGQWRCLTLEGLGIVLRTEDEALTIEDGTFTWKSKGWVKLRATYKLDPSRNPSRIDLTVVESSDGKDKGQRMLGIYELTDGELKWSSGLPGEKDRPTGFTKDGGLWLRFKREKP
jgi:uncharacterized protein (TIGR03067 family)